MINSIDTAKAATTGWQPKSAATVSDGFAQVLSTQGSSEASPPPKTALAPQVNTGLGGLAEMLENLEKIKIDGARLSEIREKQQSAFTRFSDLMHQAFDLIGKETGIPITETVGVRRSGNRFEFFANKQVNDGKPDTGTPLSHPQADVLAAVFNGTDPAYANITRKVKALLDQCDGPIATMAECNQEAAELTGKPASWTTADEFWSDNSIFGMETRFVAEGKAMADKNPADFAAFRGSIAAEDLERLSDEQVYSRFFVNRASKEEMLAALEAERNPAKSEKTA